MIQMFVLEYGTCLLYLIVLKMDRMKTVHMSRNKIRKIFREREKTEKRQYYYQHQREHRNNTVQ